MPQSGCDRLIVFFFRIAMGWTFFYAASHQLADPHWSAASFLAHTKTFHNFFAWFTTPRVLPVTNFLVEWGHLLIGLSLISGLAVRASAPFGVLLMLVYYLAHLDFPYVDNKQNFIMEFHLVYAAVLVVLIRARAGHIFGLDAVAANMDAVKRSPFLRRMVS